METIIGIIGIGILLSFPVTFVILFDALYQDKLKLKYPWDEDLNAIMGVVGFFCAWFFTAFMLQKIGSLIGF